MTAIEANAAFRTPEHRYATYAEIETAQGDRAWKDGQYHRAIKLWKSAARWSQFAANTVQERPR